MFSLDAENEAPSNAQVKAQMQKWGFKDNAIGLNDGKALGMKTYFPNTEGWRGAMLLRPGFKVVKTGLSAEDFEREIDAVLAAEASG